MTQYWNFRKQQALEGRIWRLRMNLTSYEWYRNSETWTNTIEAEDDLKRLDQLENFGDF